jgi:hypothetical protein
MFTTGEFFSKIYGRVHVKKMGILNQLWHIQGDP